MKALLITALGGTTSLVGWAATRPDAEPNAAIGEATVTAPEAEAEASLTITDEAEPAATGTKAQPADARARWQERVRSIRSGLPPAAGAATPEDAAHREIRQLVDACMEDLGANATGAVTLSMHELGAPGVGTIYESIAVVDASFDEPEVIECLTQSMYDYVGEAPAEAYEHVSVWTLPLGKPEAVADEDAQTFGYIVGAHMGEVRFCESKAEGAVTGSVKVALRIGESGTAESVVAEESKLPSAVVECLVGATKRWKFPAKLAGKRFERDFVLPVPGEPAGPVRER